MKEVKMQLKMRNYLLANRWFSIELPQVLVITHLLFNSLTSDLD